MDFSEGSEKKLVNLKPFQKGQSGSNKGRPKGRISVGHRIRAILEDGDKLPQAVKDTIRTALGEGKGLLDAIIMVGLLQAQQGDVQWAKLLFEHGWGKPEQVSKIGNLPGEKFLTEVIPNIPQKVIDAAVQKLNEDI